ncbi:DUF4157 domain-containing protein [Niveibacterium terrae]|uniref:eCIS core domain-containing protein n=1 Tax=Niveibacterium terrae TaxID=3373598 RepID=UPI003A8D9E46
MSGHRTVLPAPCAVKSETPRPIILDRAGDALEHEARRAADLRAAAPPLSAAAPLARSASDRRAPQCVHDVLATPGQALPAQTREQMQAHFHHDFSQVRIHADDQAAASAHAVSARAYTVGNHIVFNPARYTPQSHAGQGLLAHELAHVIQQRSGSAAVRLQREREEPAPEVAVAAPAAQPAPREDYVFIMGRDAPNARADQRFYATAEAFYRARMPAAHLVTGIYSLRDLLDYLIANVNAAIGNLYIVSHSNEDGTLSFGEVGAVTRLDVLSLREQLHPQGGGPSLLARPVRQIDAQTRIHIKGCNLGRTREMVELIDEAFGGAGTVSAPTHEQHYQTDPVLAARARREHRAGIAAAHPQPTPIDPALTGRARREALAQRRRALAQRRSEVAAEITARRGEEDELAARAGVSEALRGPLFQRPGSTLFSAAELRIDVDALYPHLPARQRQSLVRRLVARDRRSAARIASQGTVGQQGQSVHRFAFPAGEFAQPASAAEANRAFAAEFRNDGFRASALEESVSVQNGEEVHSFTITGSVRRRGQSAEEQTWNLTTSRSDDASLIAAARARLSNPDRYAFRVQLRHRPNGMTRVEVVAERVVAYLHHVSLDPGAHRYFMPPETDPDFFTTSTYAPPPGGAQT